MIFGDAWNEAASLRGWLTRREAELLYNAATASTGLVVEVGAYRGRSTVILAAASEHVITIDPMIVGDYPGENMSISQEDVDALVEVVARHSNVTWHRMKSTEYQPQDPVGMLYIDGKHSGEQPLLDYLHFEPHLSRNAYVAFHDYTSRREVQEAVKQAEDGKLRRLSLGDGLYLGRYTR